MTALTATTALTQLGGHMGPYPYGGGGFHWGFVFAPFAFILFWVLVIGLVRMLFWRRGPWAHGPGGRGPWGPGGPGGPGGHHGWSGTASAEQTLATRFASGDIDEQEYRARLEVLRATPPGQG